MTSDERFERIEAMLAKFAGGMNELRDGQKDLQSSQKGLQSAHIELEAAQLNQQKAHTRLEEALTRFVDETRTRFNDVGEKLANLTILVDRLIERDLGRSGGEV